MAHNDELFWTKVLEDILRRAVATVREPYAVLCWVFPVRSHVSSCSRNSRRGAAISAIADLWHEDVSALQKKHLYGYLTEFDFHYNMRPAGCNDYQLAEIAAKGIVCNSESDSPCLTGVPMPAKPKRPKKTPKASLSDQWITDNSPIDPLKLHALGALTVAWSACETHLIVLFMMMARLHAHLAWIIAHDWGDIALCDRIREIAKYRFSEGEASYQEAVLHILKVYDECRKNRNSLIHFKLNRYADGKAEIVRMKGPSMERHSLPSQLGDFRRVFEETRALAQALRKLGVSLDALNRSAQPEPLPDKLPVPSLLWKHPQQAPKAPKRRS